MNVRNYGFFKPNDFQEILNAIVSEFNRRGRGNPQYTQLPTAVPANGVFMYVSHPQAVFADIKQLDSSQNFSVTLGDIVFTGNITSAIQYVQQLMNQNIVG
ncbi:hypothetical protein D3C85_1218210 [compost metagenome]